MSRAKAFLKLDRNINSMLRMYTNHQFAYEKGRATSIVKQRQRSPKPGTCFREVRNKNLKPAKQLKKDYAKAKKKSFENMEHMRVNITQVSEDSSPKIHNLHIKTQALSNPRQSISSSLIKKKPLKKISEKNDERELLLYNPDLTWKNGPS